MAKDTSGLHFIVVNEAFLQLISRSIILQFQGLFQEHLSCHQFGIPTPRSYEVILFGILTLFDLHPDQVAIFRELCSVRGTFGEHYPLYQVVMVFIFLFTTNMGGMWKKVTIIESFSNMKQGDPLKGSLFVSARYRTFLTTIM